MEKNRNHSSSTSSSTQQDISNNSSCSNSKPAATNKPSNESYPQQSNRNRNRNRWKQSNRDAPQQSIYSNKEQNSNSNCAGATDKSEENLRREIRSKRFGNARGNQIATNYSTSLTVGARLGTVVRDIDLHSFTVKGTCQQVDKCYLRLTSAPDPAAVRPEQVLEKALLMVQKSRKNYLYKCDQLKSIRQDLTVQRIRNELTVKVYETHARLAIEVGDLSEYNQCQSQLQELYAEGNKGCDMEFSAYNLLSVILHSNNNRDLLSAMSRLSVDARKDEAVKHALAVRAAVTSGNYVLFFRLYKEAPNLSTFLMDLYVEKMRYTAVKCISRSYRPTLPVAYIAQILGFSSILLPDEPSDDQDTDELEKCAEWLKAHGACLLMDNTGEVLLDSKASTSSLFMPKPEVDVAHGDATLSVNDFLTRAPS